MSLSIKVYFVLISLFAVIVSCSNPFPDYSEKEEGVYMKLLSFEDESDEFKPNRYIIADIKILNREQLIYRQFKEEVLPPRCYLEFLFKQLNQGDSAVFKISNAVLQQEYPGLNIDNTSEYSTVYVKVYQYLTEVVKREDPEMHERIILNKYLKENEFRKSNKGIYKKILKKGSGNKIKHGKEITIHYRGYYLNGIKFDDTYPNNSFTFTYGTPGQVIRGIDVALKGMKQGEKSKIIIPSQLAFGEEGSSTQLIPPYASVIYEIEIINVK